MLTSTLTSKDKLVPVLSISPPPTLAVAPCVVAEQQITLFKFYMDQAVQDGMMYKNELYRLARQFSADSRLDAYRLGCELLEQGVPVVISVSKQQYRVWICLRNSLATNGLQHSSTIYV